MFVRQGHGCTSAATMWQRCNDSEPSASTNMRAGTPCAVVNRDESGCRYRTRSSAWAWSIHVDAADGKAWRRPAASAQFIISFWSTISVSVRGSTIVIPVASL
jgi:hypothetical protein